VVGTRKNDRVPTTLTASAVLFDMDGTLIDSTGAVERIWTAFAVRFGLQVPAVLDTIQGVRMIDSIRRWVPEGTDADAVYEEFHEQELGDMAGVSPIPGAVEFMTSLPADRVAVATSASTALALARLAAGGIPQPAVVVTADHVAEGKPDPAPYLAAARLLGVAATDCVVFEDAEAGIVSGLAAGARVVVVGDVVSAVTAGLPRIRNYRNVHARTLDGALVIELG